MSDPGCVSSQSHGVCAAPGVKQQRLQVIRDKIRARDELLSRPQRFASSRPLSRREIEIEQALFQGNDRLGFLTALYHRGTERRRHCLQRGGGWLKTRQIEGSSQELYGSMSPPKRHISVT